MKYLSLVNIKAGTKNTPRFSKGNILPLTKYPFGMVAFCPQTEYQENREGWFYDPDMPYLEGIRLTNQPSPWIGDFASLLLMVQNDIISDTPALAYSGIRLSDTKLSPDYLKVKMLRPECVFELTPTERCAKIRISLENDRQSYLSLFSQKENTSFEIDENEIKVTLNSDKREGLKAYFVIKVKKGEISKEKSYGAKNCFHIALNSKSITLCLSLSYISHELARESIENECGAFSFSAIRKRARDEWEEKLSRIKIEDTRDKMKVFYTCMYRCFLFPSKIYEIQNGKSVYFSPYKKQVKAGVRYTNTGFWDTARTLFPLYTLIAKDELIEIMKGFLCDYIDCGYLPRWTSYDERGCMPSTLIDLTIAECATKGILDKDTLELLFEGMIKHANVRSNDKRFGREGIDKYLEYGYVPCDFCKESVNLTLDFALGDYCISKVAKALGKREIEKEYLARSKNYINLFDKESGFIRPKDSKGNFKSDFDPLSWGQDYTEGSAWQTSLFVPHDIDNLAKLLGGKEQLLKRLDLTLNTKPRYRAGGYMCEIHEMTEMAQADFGQIAISNQPSFHIPYMYAYLGEKEKARELVSKMCKLFTKEGYPGDEDNGSMSAWYILSQIGKYPLCPPDGFVEIEPLIKIR
ncbi:MAG: GH92 family glycosyl hydrolase [Clostridia bacterium]|nr:GH92 family glycosyl hydrolase [Clostridia bacterium]